MTPQMISVAVAALLCVAVFWDCKWGKIPNWLALGMLVIYVANVVLVVPFDYWQLVFAAAVFAVGFALFAIGAFGAGAVKLLSVTALFMPLDALGSLGLFLLVAVIASLLLFSLLRASFANEDSSWSVLRKRVIPMAFPIAVAGLCGLFVL